MKFKVTLADGDGVVLAQYSIGLYKENEVADLFEVGGKREKEVDSCDFWLQGDKFNKDDLNELGLAIAREIQSEDY